MIKKKLELTTVNPSISEGFSSSNDYEGGESGDRQKDYFFREGRQAYFSRSKTREDVGMAEIGLITELPMKPQEPVEKVVEPALVEAQPVERSYMEFEEKLFETKDMRPLNQLKLLSERYMASQPSQMFQLNHKDTLRKYVDKTKEFKGEILFFKNHVYVFHTDNNINNDGMSYMSIKQLSLAEKLDFLPDGDIDDQNHEFSNVLGGGSMRYITIEAGAPGSPPKSPPKSPGKGSKAQTLSKEEQYILFKSYMSQAADQGRIELIQNGRFAYFWTMNTSTRANEDFTGIGQTTFELVEVDLASATLQTLKEFTVKAADRDSWIPVAVGFARRHSKKEFPFSDAGAPRDEFLQSLKKEVVTVREVKFRLGVHACRVSLRSLASFDSNLYTLFEGPFDNKFHFAAAVNSEDLLRLQERAIVNKLQVKSYERLARDVGVLYLTEDAFSNGHYQLVEVARDGSGGVAECKRVSSVTVSAPRLEGFKQRLLSSNYKYLYDEQKREFFMRKTTPIYDGAIVLCDMIMSKILFMEVDGENCRLRVTHMKNHGLSFQKMTCQQLASHKQYANFKEECLTISNLLACNLVHLDAKLQQQVIVSRTTKNMFRCEDVVFYLDDGSEKLLQYDDPQLKVKSLSLMNSDYIADPEIRQRAERLKSTRQSSLVVMNSNDWQTKDRKPFLPISNRKHLAIRYKRLMSSSGDLLLPRVTDVRVYDPNTSKMVSDKEPRLELFQFKIQGAIPSDDEDDVIASDQAWQVVNERVRFENDDSAQRPLIFCQSVRDVEKNFLRQHFWFTIYDFRAEQIVSQIHMNFPDLIVEYQIDSVDVAACSEIQQIDQNCFSQRFQVSFYLKHQLRAKIIEYTVTWDYLNGRKVTIAHTCSKELILKQPEALDTSVENLELGLKPITERLVKFQRPPLDDQPVYLIPYMDKSNQICGTQLIYGGVESPRVFVFETKREEAAIKNSKIPFVTDEGYKIYKNETFGDYTAVLAYSKLSPAMLSDTILNEQEKAEIIEDSVKSILNSVIFDPSLPVPWQLARADFDTTFLQAIDLGRGIEVLEWFSIASLKCDHPDLPAILEGAQREWEDPIYDAERYSQPAWLSFSSVLERVLANDLITRSDENRLVVADGQRLDYDRIRSLQIDEFYIKGHEIIQRDIFLNHPLHYLLDLEAESEPKDFQVDTILKFAFSEHNNSHETHHMEAQEHLMSMLGDMIARDNGQKTYYDNFFAQKRIADPTSNKSQTLQLNICQPIAVGSLPRTQGVPLQAFPYQHEVHEFRQNSAYTVDQYLQKQELEHGIDHSVECLFLDLRFYLFEQKVKHIKAHTDHNAEIMSSCYNERLQPDFAFTSFDLSNLILDIAEKTDGDIRKQKIVRHIINHQYEDTKKVNIWMLVGYTLGFFIPFFVQMYLFIEPVVLACNGLCMFTSLLLMRFEIEQLKIQGCEYFASFMNWIDLMGFFSYAFYFALRIQDPGLQMPDYKQNWVEDTLTFLSFPLIMYTSQKLLFYFKMFEQFGLFQSLVSATLGEIKVFLPFMFFWIFIFSSQLQALGGGYPLGDYPDLNEFVAVLLQTWRNSLDNVAVPDYSRWSENLRAEEKEEALGLYSYTMIFLIWMIWYLNLLFILLVLTNFLISIVGNAYGGAIDQDVEIIYALKSDLNQEVGLFNKWQGRVYPLDSLVVVAEAEAPDEADANIKDIASSLKDQRQAVSVVRKTI